jgi:hypothetical protein
MSRMRRWIWKVLTGVAALLLAGLEILGSSQVAYPLHPYGYSYAWTDYGMRVAVEQEREMVRLEGEVHEDLIRQEAERARDRSERNGKAAS